MSVSRNEFVSECTRKRRRGVDKRPGRIRERSEEAGEKRVGLAADRDIGEEERGEGEGDCLALSAAIASADCLSLPRKALE